MLSVAGLFLSTDRMVYEIADMVSLNLWQKICKEKIEYLVSKITIQGFVS